MKKIISMVLSLVIVMSLGTVALAEERMVSELGINQYTGYISARDKEMQKIESTVYKYQYTYSDGTKAENDFIPLREVCESLGMSVSWDGANQSITIWREDFEQSYTYTLWTEGVILIGNSTYIEASLIPTNVGSSSRDENSYNFYFDNVEKENIIVQG